MNYSDNYYVRTKAYSLDSNKLNESIQCDVCIVGAGLSGITTAFYLNKIDPNLKIVILEKNKIGWGASGRNGGQLLHGFSSDDYSSQKHSEDEIKTLWNFTVDAVREVKKNIKDLKKVNSFYPIVTPNQNGPGMWIHQDAWFHLGEFDKETRINYNINKEGNGVYAFLIEGSVQIDGESLEKRDALGIWDTEKFELLANQNSRVLLIEVPLNY